MVVWQLSAETLLGGSLVCAAFGILVADLVAEQRDERLSALSSSSDRFGRRRESGEEERLVGGRDVTVDDG